MDRFFFNTAQGQPAFADAVCIRAFEPSRPYPQNPQAIVYAARFQQLRAYYTKPSVNTPHPDLPQVYFADDVQFQDRPGGLVEWTRVWTTLPTSWIDFESYPYTFPGIIQTRVPFTKTVTAKVNNDYFIVGNLPTFDNLLLAYDDFANAAWTKSATTATANAIAIPACAGGNAVAASLKDDGSTGIHYAMQGSSTNGSHPVAVFLRNGNANVARVALTAAASPDFNAAYATVDLRTGLVLTNTNAVPFIAAVGDGWWRVDLNNVAGSYTNAALAVVICDDNGNTSYVGSTRTLYAWRGQMANASGTTVPHATVPPTVTPDGTNYPIATADLIPVKFGTTFTYGGVNTAGISNIAVEVISAVTTPNYNTYYNGNTSLVSVDQNNTNSYSIEAQDSTLSLWQGAIWLRQRKYVKAR